MLFLKQHASWFMPIFMSILKLYLKVQYFCQNKESNLHFANDINYKSGQNITSTALVMQ
jgi:hypothetical protein